MNSLVDQPRKLGCDREKEEDWGFWGKGGGALTNQRKEKKAEDR